MIDESGDLFTFSTSARGGIGAIATLARDYARGRAPHPGAFPVVELQVDAYQHSNSAYGRIKVPVFKCVGWEAKATFLKAAGMETPAADVKSPTMDEIPFISGDPFDDGAPPHTEVPAFNDEVGF
jgi:hypothetical protein